MEVRVSKTSWIDKLRAWWKRITGGDDNPDPQPDPTPTPTPQPTPGAPVPVRIVHSNVETFPSEFRQKERIYRDFGLSDVRYLSVTGDSFINDMGHNHARKVGDWIVADDFVAVASNGQRYVFAWDKFMSKTSANVLKQNPMPAGEAKATFRVWWRCYRASDQPGDNEPAPTPGTSNKPPFATREDITTFADTSRPDSLRAARRGEYEGRIRVANAGEATDCRYKLTNWFWRVPAVSTGYPTPDNPKSGSVNIHWDTSLDEDEPRFVAWEVNP